MIFVAVWVHSGSLSIERRCSMQHYRSDPRLRKPLEVIVRKDFWKEGQRVRYKKTYRGKNGNSQEFIVHKQVSEMEVRFKERPDTPFSPTFFEPI
jgi:hypothetical protein